MTAKHTPGGWHSVTEDKHTEIRIMDVQKTALFEPIAIIPHDDVTEDGFEEAKANARLIAAAPALLEALKRAEKTFNVMSECAFKSGLEGTAAWDNVAGAADMYGALDQCKSAIEQAEENQP